MTRNWFGSVIATLLGGGNGTFGLAAIPLPAPAYVDLKRYSGCWYPIASIPPLPERKAYDATEHYHLDGQGRLRTRFVYRRGGHAGPHKTLHSVGSVQRGTANAVWKIRFPFLPLRFDYRIAWLARDYSQVIVARKRRDYVWFMARAPQVSQTDYDAAVERIRSMGYDASHLRVMPRARNS